MPNFDTTQPMESTGTDWTPLETNDYIMKIAEAQIAPSPFRDEETGDFPDKCKITWSLTGPLTPEQEAAGYQVGQRVYQEFAPFYGTTKAGIDSKFKTFIDGLLKQQAIPKQFYIADKDNASNQGDLIGVTQRVFVEKYAKAKGPNVGKPGNKVIAVTAIPGNGQQSAPVRTGKVELADADDIVPKTQTAVPSIAPELDPSQADYFRSTYAVLNELNTSELQHFAEELRPFAGAQWKRKVWQNTSIENLLADIGRMWGTMGRTYPALTETEDLFP